MPAWSRLVRYVSSGSDEVQYGEPILEQGEENRVHELADAGKLQVRVCTGQDALDAVPSSRFEVVSKLFGPLTPNEVPIIRCIGLNYKTHSEPPAVIGNEAYPDIRETGRDLPVCPTVFVKPSPCVADHGGAIPIPAVAQSQADYEGELVVLMGKDAKNVKAEDALDYVAAYTIGNDISARDWQREKEKAGPVPQWSFSKSFDKYAPLGPCLVSSSLLGDADKQSLLVTVNGEKRQEGNTSDLCFGVRELVAFCSQGQTLQRGSLIMTGTPGGVGLFMSPPTFLKDGDTVAVEIGGIGKLVNSMKFE